VEGPTNTFGGWALAEPTRKTHSATPDLPGFNGRGREGNVSVNVGELDAR